MNRYESTKKVSFLGIIGNIFLLIIKFIMAIFSHSEAMMADAVNSAGDIFSSVMSYIGNKIAGIPSDEDHNFGHGKAEYIFSMFISIFMILVGMKILFSSIMTIIEGNTFQFSIYLVIVCFITILVKLFLYLYAKIKKTCPVMHYSTKMSCKKVRLMRASYQKKVQELTE